MSEKDIERLREIITDIIKNQIEISKLIGKENQYVTLSIPKVSYVNKTGSLKILEEILGYKPEILVSKEITISKPSIMILTFKLKF